MDCQNAATANMVKQRKEEWCSCVYVVKSRCIIYNHRHFILSLSDIIVANPQLLLLFDMEIQLSSITREADLSTYAAN